LPRRPYPRQSLGPRSRGERALQHTLTCQPGRPRSPGRSRGTPQDLEEVFGIREPAAGRVSRVLRAGHDSRKTVVEARQIVSRHRRQLCRDIGDGSAR
jgi:hypothetical protein